MSKGNELLARLRYHVTGAIERGEAVAIVEQRAPINQRNPVPRNTNGCGHYLCGTAAALCECPAAAHMLSN